MVSKEKLNRINELSKKSKEEGLNTAEKEEQHELRTEYLKVFRERFKKKLDSIEIVDDETGNNT
ncbi:DUF896 domain-containing protein [Haloplasma contractile]|uniref:Uncharacterized protein n=1 Tax=Haloplasma contractile SSD-17B TaxID=1033810 RepID=U2EF37_9MOLU|nr:DUF896 domain-containing protein [Haloplasma contractile]ERJ13538.1 hypothetical protein HLPCO_000204 [Haloplasma contractile SSD-17B]